MLLTFTRGIFITAAASVLPGVAMAQTAPPATCQDCGVVQAVNSYQEKGQTSGVGMVAGGVLGGVVGHQFGSGRGNTVATIAGAGLGAAAGNQVEKNTKTKTMWAVSIRMDNGKQRTFNYSSQPAVGPGDHVKLVDGGKRLALIAR
jgi:outer membrane lipoprotein SlyB